MASNIFCPLDGEPCPAIRGLPQTHHASLFEATSSAIFGFTLATAANYLFLPWWGLHATLSDSVGIGILFTAVSIARSYIVRRVFEHLRTTGLLP